MDQTHSHVQPPLVSQFPALSMPTLFNAFRVLFNTVTDEMQWTQGQRPVFEKTYPKSRNGDFDHAFDVILFHIVGSEIASTSNDGSRKPKGFWNVRSEKHPTKARYRLIHSGWQEAVKVQFTVYAKSNDRADELVDWWHRWVLVYVHAMKFFQARGVNEFRFESRLEDKMTKEFGQELYKRELQYSLRLELFNVVEAKELETLSVNVAGTAVQLKQLTDGQFAPPDQPNGS